MKILANVCNEVFKNFKFGYFENVQKERFGKNFVGLFRVAHGPQANFYEIFRYRGGISFSEDDPILFDSQNGIGRSLQPLIFWEKCSKHVDLDNGHCYMFDKANHDGSFSYKAVGYNCQFIVSQNSKLNEIANILIEMKEEDGRLNQFNIGKMELIENG